MMIWDLKKIYNKIYFVVDCYAALLVYDCVEKKTEILCRFLGYHFFDNSVCSKIHIWRNHVFCAPGKGNLFYDYDIETEEIRVVDIDIRYNTINMNEKPLFYQSYEIDGKIFFVGFNCLDIVQIDPTCSKGICIDLNNFEPISSLKANRMSIQGFTKENKIIFSIVDCSMMVVFNVLRKTVQICQISYGFEPLGVFDWKDVPYFYSLKGLHIANYASEVKARWQESFGYEKGRRSICNTYIYGDKIIVIPFRGEKILKLCATNMEVEHFCSVKGLKGEIKFITSGLMNKDSIWASSANDTKLFIINLNDLFLEEIDIPKPLNIEQHLQKKDLFGVIFKESKGSHVLNDYIKYIETSE